MISSGRINTVSYDESLSFLSELVIQEWAVAIAYQCKNGKDQQQNGDDQLTGINGHLGLASAPQIVFKIFPKSAEQRRYCDYSKNQEKDIIFQCDPHGRIGEAVMIQSEHAAESRSQAGKAFKTEEYPAHIYHCQRVYMVQSRMPWFGLVFLTPVFENDKSEVI